MLARISSIDPSPAVVQKRGTTKTLEYLLKLPKYVPTVLKQEEKDLYDREARKYISDTSLPPPREDKRADRWWGSLQDRFPLLSRVALAYLGCFHGPQVRRTFKIAIFLCFFAVK